MKMKKHVSIISVCALCAVTLVSLYCTKIEFDNPLDPNNGNNHNQTESGIYTITLNANNGTIDGTKTEIVLSTNKNGKLTYLPQPARSGFYFGGWSYEISNTAVDTNTVFSTDVAIIAKWVPIYIITFDANSGTFFGNSTQINCTTDVNRNIKTWLNTTPAKNGVYFASWFDTKENTGGTEITPNTEFKSNDTIYARWTSSPTFAVTFNANGGTIGGTNTQIDLWTNPSRKFTYLPVPKREHYDYLGWFTAINNGDTVTLDMTFNDGDTVYARWKPTEYTITYDLKEGVTTENNPDTYNVESNSITLINPTKNGYKFKGWTGTNGNLPDTTVTIPKGSSGNKTYTANWEEALYKITFDPNGGSSITPTYKTAKYGQTLKELGSLPTPTKDKYVLDGWSLNADEERLPDTYMITKDVILYARWTLKPNYFMDDRDSTVYRKVKIENQTWMAENLNHITSSGSYCYGGNEANCGKYGRLYNWYAAERACPTGWHLPTDGDWDSLMIAVGGILDSSDINNIIWLNAGFKLKSKTNNDWYSNGNGNDTLGFSALPGGYYHADHSNFDRVSDIGCWWSATTYSNNNNSAWYRSMSAGNDYVYKGENPKEYGFSVRCVMNNASN